MPALRQGIFVAPVRVSVVSGINCHGHQRSDLRARPSDGLDGELRHVVDEREAVVVEEIFSIPGVGRMLLAAIVQRDYALVQGGVLVIAMLFVLVNIVVDLLYGYLDPRIRLA